MSNDGSFSLGDKLLGELPGGTRMVATSPDTGRRLMTTEDECIQNQSPFDRQARVQSVGEMTRKAFLDWIGAQVMPWSADEIDALHRIVASMAQKYASLEVSLPETVYLVKTSGAVEAKAAYTRRRDVIVLPENMVASVRGGASSHGDPLHGTDDIAYLEGVTIHESFHLFSKNNPERRFALYALVGYHSTGKAVALPDVPWGPPEAGGRMPELKITNPDTPELNVYIEMKVPEDPGDPRAPVVERPLLPVLLASKPYDGGVFFDYLQWWFLAIEQRSGAWVPMMKAGRPLCYESAPLLEQYLDLIGRNFTNELFHPDEILAQNFVLVANQPSPKLLAAMRPILAGTAT